MSALKYWLWLSTRSGIGVARKKQILEHFGAPEAVYKARDREYLDVPGIKLEDMQVLMDKDIEIAGKIISCCKEIGCRTITLYDSDYPDRLRNIYDPPTVLYVKGNLPNIDDEPVVGVVGTRKCTLYGEKTAENVGYSLSRCGIVVATGLALGVDTAAVRGALRGGTPVIGVIGSGLDVIYPPENKTVFDDVESYGAVISEYPPGTPSVKTHFPARNRIISGLSVGIAVIEAPLKSGALITASRALEQGRDVFALPGNVDASTCEGTNALLREGAIPFVSAEDIIDEYIDLYPDKISLTNETESKKPFDNSPKVDYIGLGNLLKKHHGDEKAILESIGLKSIHTDDIISDTGIPAKNVLTALTLLELSGCVLRNKNGKWEIST